MQEGKQKKYSGLSGDEKGSYNLEAYFEGRLMPFNDTVNATFKTEEPLEVLAGDAMKLKIMPEERGIYWRRVLCILPTYKYFRFPSI